jgi:hypothetical protein
MVTGLSRIAKPNKPVVFVIALFSAFSLWWLSIKITGTPEATNYDYITNTYGIMAAVGGALGLITAKKWQGMKSIMGRALIFFSLGLLAQEFGQLSYAYSIYILGIDIPYPSVGDIGYFGSVLLYTYGVLLLIKVSGAELAMKNMKNTLIAVGVPAAMLISSYLVFLREYEVDWDTPLTVILDFGYPLGQAIYVALAIVAYLLSKNILGGVLKHRFVLIVVALVIQYVADYMFLYQVSRDTWSVGGINDYTYLISYSVMTIALLGLSDVYKKVQAYEITEKAFGNKYKQAISTVISAQKPIIGDLAVALANNISGLSITTSGAIETEGSPKELLEKLLDSYKTMFGTDAVDVSKQALQENTNALTSEELPAILR